jgi:thiol-disulfide isomerase/thioredoxin
LAAALSTALTGASICGCASAQRAPLPARFNPRYAQTLRSLELASVNVPYRSAELEGYPVVIAFMATYCLPCVAQVQQLKAFHEKYAARGLKVVSIGMDLDGAATLQPFAQVYELSYPLLVADEPLLAGKSVFGKIPALPATVVLGRDGAEVAAFGGVPKTDELVAVVETALK